MIVTTTDRRQAPAATVLHVAGDLDTFAAADLRDHLRRLPLGSDRSVVVDLSAVTFMSCTALSVLAEAQARLGPRLLLGTRSRIVTRLLEITGLTSFFRRLADAEPEPAEQDVTPDPGPAPARRTEAGTWTFSRTDLERVRGLLMGVHGCDAEEAWRILTRAAARHGVPVGELVDVLIGRRHPGGKPSSVAALAALTVLMRLPREGVADDDPGGSDGAVGPTREAARAVVRPAAS